VKCLICKKNIGKKETRIYSWIGKRKVYSCVACRDAFDAELDKAARHREARTPIPLP